MNSYLFLLLTHVLWVLGASNGYPPEKIQTIIEWKRLQFAYPTQQARQNDIDNKVYDPNVPAPIDVDVYYGRYGRLVFVSVPKFSPGVPATFGIVNTNRLYENDPVIEPFPSWDWHRNTARCKPDRLVSVFRVQIDRCGQLWILDSGNEGNGVICPPQILVFDLNQWPNVQVPYYTYEFPEVVYDMNSIFLTLMVEVRGEQCRTGAFAYVADSAAAAIVITDLSLDYSWRIKHSSMASEPAFSNFQILGDRFSLSDGVLGMALSPEKNPFDDDRYLYYSALSGSHESRISTFALKQSINKPASYLATVIETYPSARRSQSAAMAMSANGVAFFGLASNVSINCWNSCSYDYGRYIETVYQNTATMQFASGAKIMTNYYGREEFWVMTNRFQKLMTTGYNFNEVNFRISVGDVMTLQGSSCH